MTGYLIIAIIIFLTIMGLTIIYAYWINKQEEEVKEKYNNIYNNSNIEEKTRLEIINQNAKINKINTKITITLILVLIPYILVLIKLGTILEILKNITN